jgi:hypothetical protein
MSELTGKRSYNAKHFDNGDGTMRLESHVGHIHYKENGNFVDSDITFRDEVDRWVMDKHNYHLTVFKDFSAPLLIKYENHYEGANHTITYEPKMLAWVNATNFSDFQVFRNQQAVQGVLNGGVIRYTDAFGDGIHFEITLQRSGFKKEVVIDALNKLENPPTVNHKLVALFEYGGNGLKVLAGQTEWDKDTYLESESGFEIPEELNPIARSFIRPAYIIDAEGVVPKRGKIKVFWKKHNNKLYQAKVLPKAFLLNATYPVRADTVTSYYAGAGDGWVGAESNTSWADAVDEATADGSDYTNGSAQPGLIGDKQSAWRHYHSFFPTDTSGIGSGSTITAATLYAYQTGNGNSNPCTFSLVETSQASTSSLSTSDNTAWTKTDIGSNTVATGLTNNQYRSWGFSDLTKISKTATTKVGVSATEAISGTDPGSAGSQAYILINFSEAASNDPYIEVTYTISTFTPRSSFFM